jgi:hypothetical protein
MAKRSRSTFMKRQKEMARQQRAQDKFARRQQRKAERQDSEGKGPAGEDPDIAGIIPGPQPRTDEEF